MNPYPSRSARQKIFLWIVLAALALAIGYPAWVILRAGANAGSARVSLQPPAHPEELEAIQKGPHLLFLQQVGPHYGQVTLTGYEPEVAQHAQTTLACDRVHYAAGNGICLIYDTSTPSQDLLAQVPTWVILFGSDFQPRHQFIVEGLPSRTRVSPDGKYAAFTVFVSGHSYADANMSTSTVILDAATGSSLGDLEEFEVWKDGQRFEAIDFNFWGVTFAQDSNRFYATLRSFNTTYLVQGDLAARKLTVLRENVECPSLSPDGTRIGFKKRVGNLWQISVLNLATLEETTLAEKENIDDQVEWLDNEQLLYQKADYDRPQWVNWSIAGGLS